MMISKPYRRGLKLEHLRNPAPCQHERKGQPCGKAARMVVAGRRICGGCLAELQDHRGRG